ncbi:protein S100-A8 [Dasypus novemcinctus]|uniref:protein S100-A8 n=1 Tax=Dasypus novemcinctus TaxID=9361 RepID=UPI000328D727|nr:protein S100-A8 [Dasypus novemcinctus]
MARGPGGRAELPTIKGSWCSALYVLCQLCSEKTWWRRSLDTMLTELETAITGLIKVYHDYSLVKGNYHSLYKDDLKKLLETESPKLVKNKSAETWFKELDINSDDAINFQEFLIVVIKMGVQMHKDSHQEQ